MSLKRVLVIAVLLIGGIIAVFAFLRSAPPQVPFGRVAREDLVSTLMTNGQVQPLRGAELRAETSGRVATLDTVQGQQVVAGQVILKLDASDSGTRLEDAKAKLASARERVAQLEAGGAPAGRAELESSLKQTRLELDAAKREAATLERLVKANAATPAELQTQRDLVSQLAAREDSLSERLRILVPPAERAEAAAAVTSARIAVTEAERAAGLRVLRAPFAGTLFEFDVRLGGWLNMGDLVGRVGDLSRVRVSVFVDEPELGRVQRGLPVTIRWDAYQDRKWTGEVDELPVRIQAFGTRQVGEVICQIDNPDGDLLPGTNVNVEIVTATAKQALVIPKQALRRRLGEDGVWLLAGDHIEWRKIGLGVSSLTAVEVREGLKEGESVALIYDRELNDAMKVSPVYP